jgi:hypothetical protein
VRTSARASRCFPATSQPHERRCSCHDPQSAKLHDSARARRIAVFHRRLRRSAPVNRASATRVRPDGHCTGPAPPRRRCRDSSPGACAAGRDCPRGRSESMFIAHTRAPGNRRGVRAPACAHGCGDGRPRGPGGPPDRAREHHSPDSRLFGTNR